MDETLDLVCHSCRISLRIKAAHAHLRGRCPECGFRIMPPRPRPAPTAVISDSDEPLGLMPEEDDDWPEPAKVVYDNAPPSYAISTAVRLMPQPVAEVAPAQPVLRFSDAKPLPTALMIAPGPNPPADPGFEVVEPSGDPGFDIFTDPVSGSPNGNTASPVRTTPVGTPTATMVRPPPPPVTLETDPTTFLNDTTIPADLLPKAKNVERVVDLPQAELIDEDSTARSTLEETLRNTPTAKPFETAVPLEDLYAPYKLSDAELNPKRAKPPKQVFWSGILAFPFRPENIVPILKMLGGFWIWLILANAILRTAAAFEEGGSLLSGPLLLFLILLFVPVTAWTGSWASAYFLATVQETAAGNDCVDWPQGSWREWLPLLFKLAVVFIIWLAIPYRLCVAMKWAVFGYVCFALSLFIFPVSLLCVMARDRWYAIVDLPFLQRFLRRPSAMLGLYLYWLPLGAASMLLGGWTIGWADSRCIPVGILVALLWAFTVLVLGRVAGRVGWVVSQPFKSARKRKRRVEPKELKDRDGEPSESKPEPASPSRWND